MGVAMSMTARYARAGSQAFRLVADARGASKAAGLLLRGSPFALGWFAGWLTTEFPPHVVTGHALSRVSAPSIGRIGASWAGQRAEQTLTAALEASFGPDYADLVSHPACEESECSRAAGCCTGRGRTRAMRLRHPTFRMARAVVTTCWTSGADTTWRRAVARRC